MRGRVWRRPTSASSQPAPDPDGEDIALAELADAAWLHHATAVAETGFWAVARRLPSIVREALGLAWSASRRDTVVAVVLNVVAGVMTTFGLLATGDVLRALFEQGPTPDRVRQAVPALAMAADLFRNQREQRIPSVIGRATGTGHTWLFPGHQPGRHHGAAAMNRRLRQAGFDPATARLTALIDMTEDLPSVIAADLLGYDIQTTDKFAKITQRDWAPYLQERIQ